MRTAAPHQPAFFSHPLAVLAASFALGVLVARIIPLPFKFVLASGVASSLATVFCFVRGQEPAAAFSLMLAFCLAGAALFIIEKSGTADGRLQRLYDEGLIRSGEPVEVTGVVMGAPEPAPDGFYLTLGVERLSFKGEEREIYGQILLFAPVVGSAVKAGYEELELRHGARLRVMTALQRADNYRNPGVSPMTEYLERRKLDAVATIKSPLLIERLDDERVFLPLAWLYEWRQTLLAELDERFSLTAGGVLKAALLGNRYYLSRSIAERFRDGGTFHVLVISGLHTSFIGSILLFLTRRVTKRRAWQFLLPVVCLWAFTIAVGAEVSIARATLMFTVVALAPVVHRRARSLNALGAATLLLLVWRPYELFDPSFQLTFLSVLAIVVISWPLLERLRAVGEWRPTSETPYPPRCPRALRFLAEALFWSERDWRREMTASNYSYRLFKTGLAARLERLHVQRPLRYAFAAVVVSLSVQLMLMPLLVIYFHRLSLASLVLNIMVGALMALLAITALAALLLAQLSTALSAPLFKLTEGLNWLMIHSVDPFAKAGLASMRLPEYAGWPAIVYVLYYAPLIALAILLARWRPLERLAPPEKKSRWSVLGASRASAIAQGFFLIVIVSHPFSAGSPDGRLRIDFLDVGQGDAALVTMPSGETLLVDGGGRPRFGDNLRTGAADEREEEFERDTRSIGEAVVSEYLWWRGLDHVDYILATHADADHIEGLSDVARNFRVGEAIVGRAPMNDPEFTEFYRTARAYGIPLRLLGRGDTLRFGSVEIDVLWPPRSESRMASSGNDDSVVLRLRLGDRVFLLTGDIEKASEDALSGSGADLHCDVVKVAHHGSRTSSTEAFVRATRPTYAVVSVGLTSIFGHPHKEIMERWRAAGAEILTTGEQGTITISTDGHDLKVETFVGK